MGQKESNATVELADDVIPDAIYIASMLNDQVMIDREVNHYTHTIDVTNNSIYCVDCEVMLNGR